MRSPALVALVLLSGGFSSASAAPIHEQPSAATTCCVENRTTLQLNEVWRVEATSFRPPPSAADQGAGSEPHTVLSALRFDGRQWQTAFTSEFAGAYNAHLNVRHDITYGNQPVALLDFQLGAALDVNADHRLIAGERRLGGDLDGLGCIGGGSRLRAHGQHHTGDGQQ